MVSDSDFLQQQQQIKVIIKPTTKTEQAGITMNISQLNPVTSPLSFTFPSEIYRVPYSELASKNLFVVSPSNLSVTVVVVPEILLKVLKIIMKTVFLEEEFSSCNMIFGVTLSPNNF